MHLYLYVSYYSIGGCDVSVVIYSGVVRFVQFGLGFPLTITFDVE